MTPLPREQCPICERTVPVRSNGQLREHRVPASTIQSRFMPLCTGSGMSAYRRREIADGERA